MAKFTIGAGGWFETLEDAASDATNINGNGGILIDSDYVPSLAVAPFANTYTLEATKANTTIDTSKIPSGVCLQGGVWGKVSLRRYNNAAAVVIQNAQIDECAVYAPLQDGAVVGCSGDLNAVTTLNGDATGLTGTDNKFVVNVTGVPNAYEDKVPGLYLDGINDYMTPFNIDLDVLELQATIRKQGTDRYIYDNRGNSGSNYVIAGNVDKWLIDGSLTVTIDGSQVINNVTPVEYDKLLTIVISGTGFKGGIIGTRYTFQNFFTGVICCCDGTLNSQNVYKYINSGDFGNSVLTDHSGNGNDGAINGATWVLSQQDPLTPKIGGSLLITSGPNKGLYAGGAQPYEKKRSTLQLGIGF